MFLFILIFIIFLFLFLSWESSSESNCIPKKAFNVITNSMLLPLSMEYREYDRHNFQLPHEAWSDPYVVGFIMSSINILIKSEFIGNSISHQKMGELFFKTMILLSNYEIATKIVHQLKYPHIEQCMNNPEFVRGIDDGIIVHGVMGKSSLIDYSHPTILKAKESSLGVDFPTGKNDSSSLSITILMQTFISHMKENYYSKNN